MTQSTSVEIPAPLGLVAELTHRCPLACLYCSNPMDLVEKNAELSTEEWEDVFEQAQSAGIVQVHLSGGEPLVRQDLEQLVTKASTLKLYSNLITSGLAITSHRACQLQASGLDSVQLSLQSDSNDVASTVCGKASVTDKLSAASCFREAGLPLTWNIVLHRLNMSGISAMVDLCARFEPHRIELAHVQYHGRALPMREQLLPTMQMLAAADEAVQELRAKYGNEIEIVYVKPDWFESYPKPCNGGWGKMQMTIAPDGTVLPCPAAKCIVDLKFENVRSVDLKTIWYQSDSFNAFRGQNWMSEPCSSCERRFLDFGGCRCQAFALTGNARKTDPVCVLSADRKKLEQLAGSYKGLY
jgi:PqqA peptide cyclase